jgi:hypothetical protein
MAPFVRVVEIVCGSLLLIGLVTRLAVRRAGPKSGFTLRTKVNSRSPNPQLLIALHSPNGLRETGLRICSPEKNQDKAALAVEQFVLSSPCCEG